MSVSLQDLRDVFYGILREEEQDTSAYPLDLVDLLLNAAQSDICAGRVINPISKEEARKGDLHFLNFDAYYSNVNTTYTTADIAVGAVTIPANTTNYPATGKLYLGGQVVSYTGVTGTEFTGVSGVLFAFPAGTQISIAFTLPTDFSAVINITYNNKFKLPAKQYDDIFEDLNSFKGSNFQRQHITSMYESPYRVKPFYTIKDAQYLLLYQLNDNAYPIHLRYEKIPPTMVMGTTPVYCTIDDDTRAKLTIPHLAVGTMLYHRGEEARAAEILSFAISQIKQLYSYYNDTTYESQNGVAYKMGKGKLNI